MEEHKAHKGYAAGNGMVGMVIGGRAAKACDVCGKERARWYCAADLAYLCERCDGSVHAANALARRHERVRLGPNGAPMKIPRSTPAVNVSKRDAVAAAVQPPVTHLNPRKRPRSIRRHKPSSLHALKHGMSLIHASNCNSIFGSNHSIMINNPRNDPEFVNNINNNNDDFFNKVFIKAEPLSPIDIGDQVKVPDHTDIDDPLLESLFDFRDLHDDDLFLHEVPIYNPQLVQSQDTISPSTLHSEQCEEEEEKEEDEAKPSIIPIPSEKSALDVINTSSFAIHHPSYLSQAEGADQDVPIALPLGKCNLPNRFIDSDNNSICDLDQLDFDSVLHGHDEDEYEMDRAPSMGGSPFHEHNDSKECNYTEISHGQTLVRDEDGYGNGMENTNDQYNGHIHAGYGENAFDFDARGSESPRTWLCKVKVESPPQLGMMNEDEDVLLREKLSACQSLCSGSSNGFKLGLRLNFEDVLNAWCDKGTFWMDGQPPHQLSSCLDFLGGWMVPDMNSPSIEGASEGQQLVPMLHHKHNNGDGGARKASVLRYREKRRTRLFCKKIRYEVRKLNAEKRPRMKGRFVKRISIVV